MYTKKGAAAGVCAQNCGSAWDWPTLEGRWHEKKGGGHTQQISMDDSMRNAEYDAFVEKFKPKLTTDDCYTPENVYEAVKAWVLKHYDIDQSAQVVRPFWPGADYKREAYPEGCVVIDNPPFSIISEIEQWYMKNGIRFFLFAPALTIFKPYDGLKYVLVDESVTYANGADVATSFVTNMGEWMVETSPELHEIIRKANNENLRKLHKQMPKYELPVEVATAARLRRLAKYGVHYTIRAEEAKFVRSIESMKAAGKAIFGGGLLLAERAAAERAAAEQAVAERAVAERAAAERENVARWELSETERDLSRKLGQ